MFLAKQFGAAGVEGKQSCCAAREALARIAIRDRFRNGMLRTARQSWLTCNDEVDRLRTFARLVGLDIKADPLTLS